MLRDRLDIRIFPAIVALLLGLLSLRYTLSVNQAIAWNHLKRKNPVSILKWINK